MKASLHPDKLNINPLRYYLSISLKLIFILVFCSSCSSTKNLQKGEYILKKNKIIITSPEKIKNKTKLLLDLQSLYKQTPVTERFWNPRFWFSNAEKIVYSEELTQETSQVFEKFLRNKKGFYDAEVRPLMITENRNIEVQYHIKTGKRYHIRSIQFSGMDKEVLRLVKDHQKNSFIHVGDPLDASDFDKEKSRITTLLQNNGYINFVSNFIDLRGDSSDYKADVIIDMLSPLPDSTHQKYRIGNVNIYTEHLIDIDPYYQSVDTLNDQYYYAKGDEYIVKPSAISNAVFLKKGNVYNKDLRLKTVRSLNELSTYRYVYVNPKVDSVQDSIINFDIFLTPYQNKWIVDLGSDLFYSTVSQIGRKLFGVSGNASFQNRNLLKGAELYSLDIESTLEFDLAKLDANSVSFRIENGLELPRQVDLFGLSKLLNSLGLIKDSRYQSLKDESTTDLRLGYTFSKIIDFYTLNSFNASWGYDYRPNAKTRYLIRQTGLNYLSPVTDSLFEANILASNPLLQNSFTKNLSTGFLFRDFSYFYQSTTSQAGNSIGLLANFEVSGLETYALNKLTNAISGKDSEWSIGSINFTKYIKTQFDFRHYHRISQNATFASRINWGIALPFGGDDVVPYSVQYFVGGPNSVRAWQARELGPGGYSDLLENPIEGQPFFQSGDFKLEFNLEYRTKLFWYLEGALFLDGGNVWTLDSNDSREGSRLSSKFFKQMALGIGYGIRMDFTYFLIRFDFGFKLRNPFPDEDTNSYYALTKEYNSIPFGNINIAVNYPF